MTNMKRQIFELFYKMEINPEKYNHKYINDVFNMIVRNDWLEEYCEYSAELFIEFGL